MLIPCKDKNLNMSNNIYFVFEVTQEYQFLLKVIMSDVNWIEDVNNTWRKSIYLDFIVYYHSIGC